MTPGKTVLVRSSGGEPLLRTIWAELDDSVLICLREEFIRSQREGGQPFAVPCPKENVFTYDEQLFESMRQIAYSQQNSKGQLEHLWGLATHYYQKDIAQKGQ